MKPKLLEAFLKDSDFKMKSVHEQFSEGASLQEGISGQLGIDTTYENTVKPALGSRRAQWDRAAPIPLK